ncbi:uncharacterized protein LOC126695849 [Quercus robur]|uniref:uncharacterized protein LOC126695849 n=1 Tax=Quercus robur TaxID=38942 RepID=UPI00216318C4|nr:uncharacterized protein LOC126695849 [Quercus robur]
MDHKTDSTRSVASLTTRWGTINRETIKFVGSLAKIETKNESGTTAHDKDYPKWASTMPRGDSRKEMPQTPDLIDQGVGADGIMDFERPIGRKAEKANRKRKDDGKDIATEYLKKKMKVLEEGCVAEKERFISMGRSFFPKLLDDDSDEDEIIIKLLTGSTPQRKHRQYIERNHLAGHRRLYDDYFAEEPVYPPNLFRRRFRMRRSLFLRILSRVEAHEPYFTQKRNAAKKLGLSPLQKMAAALRMLAYGVAANFMDEYVRIAETTAITSLKKFVATVVAIFSEEYLRSPNNEDIARLLAHDQNRGFPAQGRAPTAHYSINGDDYTMGYYLADDIYLQWSTFVKTIPRPLGAKRKLFAKAQEAYRKDVERAFGVLQARFAIVRGLARFFYHETLQDIMKACIIIHNMIIEDERDEAEAVDLDYEQIDKISCTPMSREPTNEFTEFIQVHQCIRDREVHSQLQMNLVEHLWQLQGES